jgi:ribose 5-phosphate isomerase B
MRIHIATDHAGLETSHFLIDSLTAAGHEVFDHGPKSFDPLDDYPSFCINAALAVIHDQQAGVQALGVVLGGSGNGEQMAANKVAGIRAALVWNEDTAKLARSHNDANVLSMGARVVGEGLADEIVAVFLGTDFEGGRHERRVAQLAEIESEEASR